MAASLTDPPTPPPTTGEVGTSTGPSLTVLFADGNFDLLTAAGKVEMKTKVVDDVVGKSDITAADVKEVRIHKGSIVVHVIF